MKNLTVFLILGLVSISTWARPISSLPGFSWEVVATNPQCDGVEGLPRDAWCSQSDLAKNLLRQDTPEFKLLRGIRDPETTHIRMTYLSFGNERVAKSLCEALRRGVTVELVLDSSKVYPVEQELRACNSEKFTFYSRGNSGGAFFGAGNLTNSAFTRNFENFYLVTLPEVTEEMQRYHQHLWNDLATKPEGMPQKPL